MPWGEGVDREDDVGGRGSWHTGDVEQGVERAVELGDGLVDARDVREIDRDVLVHGGRGLVPVQAVDEGAGGQELGRDGCADAGGGTGHDETLLRERRGGRGRVGVRHCRVLNGRGQARENGRDFTARTKLPTRYSGVPNVSVGARCSNWSKISRSCILARKLPMQ